MMESSQNLIARYLWGLKPGERNPVPTEAIEQNDQIIRSLVCDSRDLEDLVLAHPVLDELWDEIPWWIVKADIGRLLLVYHHGGFYFDVDCTLRSDFTASVSDGDEIVLFTEFLCASTDELGPRENKDPERVLRIANYAFGALAPRHPFFLDAIDEATERLGKILDEDPIHLTEPDVLWVGGPDVITSIYHERKEQRNSIKLLDSDVAENAGLGSWQ